MKKNHMNVLALSVSIFFLASFTDSNIVILKAKETEEKVYCNATIEDEFASDNILVALTNKESLKFKNYTNKDFDKNEIISVTDLSKATEEMIIDKLNNNTKEKHKRSVKNLKPNQYRKILSLKIKTKTKENVLKIIKKLEQKNFIYMASPDYYFQTNSNNPNDSDYVADKQWALERIQTPEAWDINTGSSNVLIGIIDTGIDSEYEDLSGRINDSLSRSFSGESIYDASETSPEFSPIVDNYNHGTAVAGIIGANTNNSRLMAGINWNSQLVSLRIINGHNLSYYETESIVSAINYATSSGIDIINMSMGEYENSLGYQSGILNTAINNFTGLIVCSAGNENINLDLNTQENNYFPAECDLDNVIVVGASSFEDNRWIKRNSDGTFSSTVGSNYGATTVDLFAPGENIHTLGYTGNSKFGQTSAAAPFVTGVASLILSEHPNYTASHIKHIILGSVDKFSSFTGLCKSGGRLNAYKALSNAHIYNLNYTNINSSTHGGYCVCGNYAVQAHEYSYLRYTNTLHKVSCECGYSYNQPHTIDPNFSFGNTGKCMFCGTIVDTSDDIIGGLMKKENKGVLE